jgi:mevalonate kinase
MTPSQALPLSFRSYSAPGKTFLLGEHLALDGGPSILASTSPRFELRVSDNDTAVVGSHPFAEASPAGRYFARHSGALSDLRFEFLDHHLGKGGLGASSAQFALVMAAHRGVILGTEACPWSEVLEEYRACAWNGEGHPPSGADVVSQISGGLTWFDGKSLTTKALQWNFETIGFTLIRTGHKLATHEHLKAGGAAPHSSLRVVVEEGRKAFETADEMRFIEAVNACAHVLRESGLTTQHTLGLLEQMRLRSELVFAVKGCGAMGADVILAVHDRSKTSQVEAMVQELGLETCGGLESLSAGLESHTGKERA